MLKKIDVFLKSFFNTILTLCKILIQSDLRLVNLKSQSLKDSFIILGNGPSLEDSLLNDIVLLKSKVLCCVNQFATTAHFEILKPENYVLLDEAFVDEHHEIAQKTISALVTLTSWPLKLFLPVKFKKCKSIIRKLESNPNIEISYFNNTIAEGFDSFCHFLYRHRFAMPRSQNVLIAALAIGIIENYKKIILLGADHSWHEGFKLTSKGELWYEDSHFYGKRAMGTSYFVNEKESFLAQQFLSLHKVFKAYERLNKFAAIEKVEIINSSTKSYIDVFKKEKLSNIKWS